MKKTVMRNIAVFLCAFAAGMIGGLFGTGGGILIVFLFSKIYAKSHEYDKKDCFAMTVAAVTMLSMVSLISYIQKGVIQTADIIPIMIPAALGGITGAFLLEKIKNSVLQKLFAALVIYAGLSMLFR